MRKIIISETAIFSYNGSKICKLLKLGTAKNVETRQKIEKRAGVNLVFTS